jgi:hypothetical protein
MKLLPNGFILWYYSFFGICLIYEQWKFDREISELSRSAGLPIWFPIRSLILAIRRFQNCRTRLHFGLPIIYEGCLLWLPHEIQSGLRSFHYTKLCKLCTNGNPVVIVVISIASMSVGNIFTIKIILKHYACDLLFHMQDLCWWHCLIYIKHGRKFYGCTAKATMKIWFDCGLVNNPVPAWCSSGI